MTTALIPHDPHLDALWTADLLCGICQLEPWTQRASFHHALLCAACAAGEPGTEEEEG